MDKELIKAYETLSKFSNYRISNLEEYDNELHFYYNSFINNLSCECTIQSDKIEILTRVDKIYNKIDFLYLISRLESLKDEISKYKSEHSSITEVDFNYENKYLRVIGLNLNDLTEFIDKILFNIILMITHSGMCSLDITIYKYTGIYTEEDNKEKLQFTLGHKTSSYYELAHSRLQTYEQENPYQNSTPQIFDVVTGFTNCSKAKIEIGRSKYSTVNIFVLHSNMIVSLIRLGKIPIDEKNWIIMSEDNKVYYNKTYIGVVLLKNDRYDFKFRGHKEYLRHSILLTI